MTSLSATSPLLYDNTTGVFSIQQASGSQAGFLSSTDWTTFNNKVPSTRTLSINGTAYDLSADRSWTITPNINATTTQDYTATSGQTTFTVTGGYTVGQLAVFYNGSKLAAAEFTATNGTTFVLATACQVNDIVQAVVSVTGGGIGGSGTTNYLAKFSASGVVGNSLLFDNGTNVGIGTSSPLVKLQVTQPAGTTIPTLGTSSGGLFVAGDSNQYGLYIGNDGNTGSSWLQAMRNNTATAYNILLNPVGGNAGIGTSSPVAYTGYNTLTIAGNTNGGVLALRNASNNGLNISVANDIVSFDSIGTSIPIIFNTVGIERMRITSGGDLCVNQSAPPTVGGRISVTESSARWALALTHTGGSQYFIEFLSSGQSERGAIYSFGGALTYATSSDYRLKDDYKEFTALDKVLSIPVYDFKWKDAGIRDYGFKAHELQDIYPNLVTGEKDEVKEDGSIKTQMVDYGRLTPILVKAIQEQTQIIKDLEARIVSLEIK